MRGLTPGLMGLVPFCFFLPWASVSCSGNNVAALNGAQFITGTTVQGPLESKTQLISSYWPAIALAVVVLFAFLFSFFEAGSALAAKIIASIFVIGIKLNIDDRILTEGRGLFRTKYEIGYIILALSTFAGLIVDAVTLSQRKEHAG